MKNVNSKKRNSSFELLRIFCIIGIVIMHTNGNIMSTCTGINMLWCHVENGIFQAGVSIFVLISGYFGISRSVSRVVKLERDILFYSVLGGVLSYAFLQGTSMELLKSFLPISTNKYWFLTCYMILMLFSPYINELVEKMEKKDFEKLLLLFFAVFSVLPTFVYFDVLQQGGKSVVNMLFLYLLGRYINKYGAERYATKYLILGLVASFVISVGINVLSSYITGGVGAHIPMSRDCSAFIIIEAVCIFLLFRNYNFYSRVINGVAKHVVAVYMFEGVFRNLFTTYVYDWNGYQQMPYWCVVSILVAILSFLCCILIDVVKNYTIDRLIPVDKMIKKFRGYIK